MGRISRLANVGLAALAAIAVCVFVPVVLGTRNGKQTGESRGVRQILRMLLLLCVFWLGYLRMEGAFALWHKMEKSLPEDKELIRLSGQAADIREKGNYQVLTVKTEKMGKVLVYVEEPREIGIGQKIAAVGKVSRPKPATNPGQFDLRKYYRSQGISMMVFASKLETPEEGKGFISPYFNGLYRFRRKCSQILGGICQTEDEGVFRAAILGEKEGMDGELKDLYQKSGIAHLLAISGLHLSMLGMGLYGLLRKMGLGYGCSGVFAGAAMVSYGLMTGGSGSALRAVIMLLVSFLAAYLGRSYDLLSALSLAALLLAGSRPFSIGEAGFQLSFGAVLGIGLLGDKLIRGAEVKGGWQKSLVSSLSVQLMTAPVIFWHYFRYPVYGIFLNLLVIPLMAYVILSGLLGIGLGWLFPVLGVAAVGSGHYILWWYEKLCRIFAVLPGGQAVFGRPGWGQMAAYYLILWGMIGILGLSGGRIRKKLADIRDSGKLCWENRDEQGKSGTKDEGEEEEKGKEDAKIDLWIRRGKRIFLLVCSLCCFFVLRPLPQKGCHIAFLDVGQGDGIVIRWERDEKGKDRRKGQKRAWTVLVDGGSTSEKKLGENRLEPYLEFCGITWIDAAIVSHGDEDHISGLRYLLEEGEIRIGQLILPELGRQDPAYDRLISAAGRRGTKIAYMKAGDCIEKGKGRLTCLYPEKEERIDPSDRNQQSLIIKMDYEDFHLLLTGDADGEGEGRTAARWGQAGLSDIQVLKAAHHGSRFSNSKALLEAASPKLAVISYEKGNSYGHPHQETLKRLEEAGVRVLGTGEKGAGFMHIEEGRLSCRPYLP